DFHVTGVQTCALPILDETTVTQELGEVKPDGVVIYDPDVLGDAAKELVTKENCIGLPFARMAEELGQPRIMANAVAAGAVWALRSEERRVGKECRSRR